MVDITGEKLLILQNNPPLTQPRRKTGLLNRHETRQILQPNVSLLKMQQQSGVTLIELIVTISIMAVLLAIGAPSFQSMIVSNGLTSQTNILVSALNLARSEAIKRNRQVAVVAETADAWKYGWRVCVYLPTPQEKCDPNESDIQHYSSVSGNLDIKNTAGFKNRVVYNPDGRSNNGHFDVCSLSSDTDYREIIIALTGRVKTATQSSKKTELSHDTHDAACL